MKSRKKRKPEKNGQKNTSPKHSRRRKNLSIRQRSGKDLIRTLKSRRDKLSGHHALFASATGISICNINALSQSYRNSAVILFCSMLNTFHSVPVISFIFLCSQRQPVFKMQAAFIIVLDLNHKDAVLDDNLYADNRFIASSSSMTARIALSRAFPKIA